MRPIRDAVATALLLLPGLLSAEALPVDAVPAANAVKVAIAVEVIGPLDLVEYPTARVVGEEEARAAGAETLASALALVLGASPVRVGDRAEAGFQLRGFDLRRVPVYVDGIPVYVPYDGVVDLDRFLLAASGGIVVNSGFSSLTYGPNALGGTVNLLRRRPVRPLEGRFSAGGGSGGRGTFQVSAGAAGKGWYVEGTAAHRRVDDALRTGTELQREESFSRDTLATVTFGFCPAEGHEVSLSVIEQDGEKGQPPYAGDDPRAKVRFWRWPDWDKRSVYLRSSHQLAERWDLRATLFHDRFANTLDGFDDATVSLAWEEELRVGSLARLVLGASVDDQRSAEANGLPRGSATAMNGTAALLRPVGPSTELHLAVSRRTRMPTLEDRYSYRLGVSEPNPGLGPETALTGVPGLRATAWFTARASRFLSVRIAGEMESGRTSRTPSGATRELGGFALLHAAARLGLGHGLELDLRCDNALDRRYSCEEGYPEAARSVGGALSWAF